jgi:hypothetical protein
MATSTSVRARLRRGSALTLTAIALVPLLGMAALALDWGRLCVAKAELQRAADAAAMAGAWELLDASAPGSGMDAVDAAEAARDAAIEYAALNESFGQRLRLPRADVHAGFLAPGEELQTASPERFNAVQVRLRRDKESNGAVAMFFAGIIGTREAATSASATAMFMDDIAGFAAPADGSNLPILPFALDSETWRSAVSGEGTDEWRWDPAAEAFVRGSDGIPEFNMYPEDAGSPGNRGTVNIGRKSNSTRDIARQITDGVSAEDLEFHDGRLEFDDSGELRLSGDPGISAGFKDELSSIKGEGRVIPVFRELEGSGGAGVYTITEWAGIRVAEVQLTGGEKRVVVQAAKVLTGGVLAGSNSNSQFVFSRVWICR